MACLKMRHVQSFYALCCLVDMIEVVKIIRKHLDVIRSRFCQFGTATRLLYRRERERRKCSWYYMYIMVFNLFLRGVHLDATPRYMSHDIRDNDDSHN